MELGDVSYDHRHDGGADASETEKAYSRLSHDGGQTIGFPDGQSDCGKYEHCETAAHREQDHDLG